jgi:tRNA G46 methylase TrmB
LEKVVAELARVLKPSCYLELSADSLFFVTWAFLNEKNLEKALQVLDEGKYMNDSGDVLCCTRATATIARTALVPANPAILFIFLMLYGPSYTLN